MKPEAQQEYIASHLLREPSRKRARASDLDDEDYDENGRPIPAAVLPVLSLFSGLHRPTVVAVFDQTFVPKKDLIKLRAPEFRVIAPEAGIESFDLKSTSAGLQFCKVTSAKDFGHDPALWSHCFVNYMGLCNSFFADKHPAVATGMLLFFCRVIDLARKFKWQDCILDLALEKHQLMINEGILNVTPANWRIGVDLEANYLSLDNFRSAKPASLAPSPRPGRSSAAAANNDKVTCEKFNSPAGCHWRGCFRRHVCSKCSNDHPAIDCKVKPAK